MVLQSKSLVGFSQRKIVLYLLSAAPDSSRDGMYAFREPCVLHGSVMAEHIQCSYLQNYEDSRIKYMSYDTVPTQDLIS